MRDAALGCWAALVQLLQQPVMLGPAAAAVAAAAEDAGRTAGSSSSTAFFCDAMPHSARGGRAGQQQRTPRPEQQDAAEAEVAAVGGPLGLRAASATPGAPPLQPQPQLQAPPSGGCPAGGPWWCVHPAAWDCALAPVVKTLLTTPPGSAAPASRGGAGSHAHGRKLPPTAAVLQQVRPPG